MTEQTIKLPWTDLSPNPLNRLVRGSEQDAELDLEALAASIGEEGVIQHLVVVATPHGPTPYTIIAGERRWRAARSLGDQAPLLPCHVRESLNELDQLVLMGVENLQRRNLNPIAEARYYQALRHRGLDNKAIARRTGQRMYRVQRMLRLLDLPIPIQEKVEAGQLQVNAAEQLKELPAAQQVEIANKMQGRTAKDIALTARLVQRANGKGHNGSLPKPVQPGKKDKLEVLGSLVVQLLAQFKADAVLLQQCADALVYVEPDLSAQAFSRAQLIRGKTGEWMNVRHDS